MLIWTNFHRCFSAETDKNIKTCARMRKTVIAMDVYIPEWNSATITCERPLQVFFHRWQKSKWQQGKEQA